MCIIKSWKTLQFCNVKFYLSESDVLNCLLFKVKTYFSYSLFLFKNFRPFYNFVRWKVKFFTLKFDTKGFLHFLEEYVLYGEKRKIHDLQGIESVLELITLYISRWSRASKWPVSYFIVQNCKKSGILKTVIKNEF